VGEFELGDNGNNAKSAPIRLTARSGKAIEHWYWGRVIHDMAGMHLHKSRIPIDYVHDSKEIIGYLNKFDSKSGDLVTSGALVPFKDTDRATEILHKLREGVPYEASINFGGDGIKIEEIEQGQVTAVNGSQFEGPGVVIREWPLRGVAICPYGADSNTESVTMGAGETVTAQEWKHEKEKEIEQMTAEKPAVEAEPVVEALAAVETPVVEAEAKPTVESVTAQLTESASRLTDSEAQRVTLTTERDEARTALATAQAEVAKLRTEKDAADKARQDAETKLAAITSGQPPVSAAPAEGKEPTSWMERARKNKKG
jgi:hypothetical protein